MELLIPSSLRPPDSVRTGADILVTDDNAALLTLLCDFLRGHGFHVESAANGRQAIRRLGQRAFKLVITDIYMPEADGLELIMHLRNALPRPSIIAMSGEGSTDPELSLATARLLGAQHLLIKPFPLAELLTHVQSAIGVP